MSNDKVPAYEKAPTFDEIVKYAVDNGFYGKISLVKFFDYYGTFKGKGGIVIDWRSKMREWAERQKTSVIITAKEADAYARVKAQAPAVHQIDKVADLWKLVYSI